MKSLLNNYIDTDYGQFYPGVKFRFFKENHKKPYWIVVDLTNTHICYRQIDRDTTPQEETIKSFIGNIQAYKATIYP